MTIVRLAGASAPRYGRRNLWAMLVASAACLALAWYFITLILAPNVATLLAVISPETGAVADTSSTLFGSERTRSALIGSVAMALASIVVVNVVGVCQALFTEAIAVPGRSVLTVLYATPLVFGSVAAVSGYLLLYGERGIATRVLQSWIPAIPDDWFSGFGAVLFVHTFTMTGYHFLFLRPALRRVDFSLVEAARTLGQRPLRAMVVATLPALKPTLLASTVMTFITAISSFAAPSILGGEDFEMIAPLIQALAKLGRADMAAILGVMTGIVASVLLVWVLHTERRSAAKQSKLPTPFQPLRLSTRGGTAVATLLAWTLAVITVAPLVVSIALSFLSSEAIRNSRFEGSVTLDHYRSLFSDTRALDPIGNSTVISLIAIMIALAVGASVAQLSTRAPAAVGQTLQLLAFIPYFLPGILVALSFVIAFSDQNILVGDAVLVGTFWVLPLAYSVILLPMVVRFLSAGYASLDPSQDEAARVFGARGLTRYRVVVLPVILPILIQTAALSFNATFDEYTVAVMLYNVNNQPLGVELGALAASRDPDMAGLNATYIALNTLIALGVVVTADRCASSAARRGAGAR